MSVIVSENGKNAERLNPSSFDKENYLQQYIYDNPDAIPVYEIDEDIRLLVLAREFQTSSGPIDALGVDQNGNIYLIETKLYKNEDKRRVIAQVLDYGASLWSNSFDFIDFLTQLDRHTHKQFGLSTTDKLQEFFGVDDDITGSLLDSVQRNLNSGTFKFVVLMDTLHKPLKDLIIFLNRNSQFDIYAVELEYYRHKSFEIIIPKMFGTEVKKDVVSKSNNSSAEPWVDVTVDDFVKDIEKQLQNGVISFVGRNAIVELHQTWLELVKKIGGSIWYFYRPKEQDVRFGANDATGKMFLYLESSGNLGDWPGKRNGKHIDFTKSLINNVVALGILNKTQDDLAKTRFHISLKSSSASDNDISRFIEINRQELAKHYE